MSGQMQVRPETDLAGACVQSGVFRHSDGPFVYNVRMADLACRAGTHTRHTVSSGVLLRFHDDSTLPLRR